MIMIEYFPPLFQVRYFLCHDSIKLMAIFEKVDFTMKFFFSLAEIETKSIVESVCQKTYEKKYELNQALPSQTTKQVRNSYVPSKP